ncbi:MAG: hypothetical protein ING29_13050 [Azospirillum sp.]|nr:hypothetical protein [Azospirillum sp.]
MTKYFVDANGNYLGGFEGVDPPEGAIEIPEPPPHGWMVLTPSGWVMPPEKQAILDALPQ